MENREAIADCLRRIILSDGQGAAAAIADAFRLGRIGDDVIAGAAVRANAAARHPLFDHLVGDLNGNDMVKVNAAILQRLCLS